MTPEIFGVFLREQRKANNLTQRALAETLHVSTNAVSKWERGKCLPEVTKFEDIASALNITLIEVMQCKILEDKSQEANEILTDTIKLATNQHKRKFKRTIGLIFAAIVVSICIYVFPCIISCRSGVRIFLRPGKYRNLLLEAHQVILNLRGFMFRKPMKLWSLWN